MSMGILQVHISVAVLVLCILLLRVFARKHLPKRIFPILWGVALMRLWLPAFVPLPAGSFAAKVMPIPDISQKVNNLVQAQTPSLSVGAGEMPLQAVWQGIWLAGAGMLGLFFLLYFFVQRRRLSGATPVQATFVTGWLAAHKLRRQIRVLRSDRTGVPVSLGILRPRVIFPANFDFSDEGALAYILAHEQVHIRRLDGLCKAIAYLTLCLSWFNPAVWVMVCFMNRDLELSCDERVLKEAGEEKCADYAKTLVRMARPRSGTALTVQGFGVGALKERIGAIMRYKKLSARARALCVAIVLCAMTVFAAAPVEARFPTRGIPPVADAGAILLVGQDQKLYVDTPGLAQGADTKSASSPRTEPGTAGWPKREAGMRLVYSGDHNLTKIRSADGSLYYVPKDKDTPQAYRQGTWFIADASMPIGAEDGAFRVDTAAGMQKAQAWVRSHTQKERADAILQSLRIQRDTQILIYLQGGLA